jgi:hypothetical protein
MHRGAKTAICLGAVLGTLLLIAAPSGFAASDAEPKSAGGYTAEPFSTFEQQLSSKHVKSVVFIKKLRLIRIKLDDGSTFVAKYPKKQSASWEQKIRRGGATVVKLSPEQEQQVIKEVNAASGKGHHKHKIRYIIGAVVIVLIVVGAIVLLVRRRRLRD